MSDTSITAEALATQSIVRRGADIKHTSQILDPLRFPLQNGWPTGIGIEQSLPNSVKSTPLPVKVQTMTQGETNVVESASELPNDSLDLSEDQKTPLLTTMIPCITTQLTTVSKSSKISLSQLEFSLPVTEIYEPETVDFPSSPTTFRSSESNLDGIGVRLAEGEAEVVDSISQEEEEEDKSVYTAILSPPTGQVTLKKVERPKSLEVKKKRLTVTEELLNVAVEDDVQSVSSLSYHNSEEDDDDDAQMLSHEEFTDMLTPDDIDTPDELEESIMERLGPRPNDEPLQGCSLPRESMKEERSWRSTVISGIERRIDMKVIEPYKKVLSHGGYMPGGGSDAIIVFSACFLPDRSRKDYDYVMDHLFMYVLTTLDQLIADDYVLVYLHGATTRANMPSFAWLKRCYQMIDRRLRKNLQGLYLVHPSFWVKTVVVMARPFVSMKFSRKLRFVTNLKELVHLIPLDQTCIPSRVKQYDEIRESLLATK